MQKYFNAEHALKSPAHITLQRPFRCDLREEESVCSMLSNFAAQQSSFDVQLSNYDHFGNSTLFIKVVDHAPIAELHNRLKACLRNELSFPEKGLNPNLHPHMTIATRDLEPGYFENAWDFFQSRQFSASFRVKSLFLLKHDGKVWDILEEFPFHA